MRNRLLPVGLILLLALLLTPVFQEFIREAVVAPLLYVVWVGVIIFYSIPQTAIWWLFLIVALFIAGRSLVKKRRSRRQIPRYRKPQSGRIETWTRLLGRADQESYYRWQLAQQLRKLTLEALAHDERLTPRQIQQRLSDQALDMPPEIEAYLQASLTTFSYYSGSKPRFGRGRDRSPLDLDPERVIEFLEDKIR